MGNERLFGGKPGAPIKGIIKRHSKPVFSLYVVFFRGFFKVHPKWKTIVAEKLEAYTIDTWAKNVFSNNLIINAPSNSLIPSCFRTGFLRFFSTKLKKQFPLKHAIF